MSTTDNETKRILDLRKQLDQYNYEYYVQNHPTISDFEFDTLLKELEDLENNHPELFDPNSPTHKVGNDVNQEFTQHQHMYPMLSLSNSYSFDELREFDTRIRKATSEEIEYVCELKYDGSSICLTYEDGNLSMATTRGDGVRGDVVTNNVRTIRTLPLKLRGEFPQRFEIRGEILMPFSVFNHINQLRAEKGEQLFANPRNAAAGTLKQLKSAIVAERKLDCFLYNIPAEFELTDTHWENLELARSWGFNVPTSCKLCKTIDDVWEYIAYWDKARADLSFPIDGIVVKLNNLGLQRQLGNTAKSPRWAIAYKFKAERVETELQRVVFQVGRTGAITPVAEMTPVHVAGTMVKRASLHNADIIQQLDLHIGDFVYVEKGGEIIPKIVGVNTEKREENAELVKFITHCPECGTKLVREEGEANFYCPNSEGCPPQIAGRIQHFVSRKAMNIDGLGEEIIDILLDKKLIRNVSDIYKLNLLEDQLIGVEKIIYPANYEVTHIPLSRVLYAFEIPFKGISSKLAGVLAERFGSLSAIISADKHALLEAGISMAQYMKMKEQQQMIFGKERLERLLVAGDMNDIPLDVVLNALTIPKITKEIVEQLAVHFDYVYELSRATKEELMTIEGINDEQVDSILLFMSKNEKLITRLNTLSIFRLKERSVTNLLDSIEHSKTRGADKLLFGLGVRYIGERASSNLLQTFGSIDALRKASFEDLIQVEDVGEQMAKSLCSYFKSVEHNAVIDALLASGVVGEVEKKELVNENLSNKTFVITGTLSKPRDHFKSLILERGGKVTDSISSKTDFLLAGEKAGSKMTKAEKLGVTILSEDEFLTNFCK